MKSYKFKKSKQCRGSCLLMIILMVFVMVSIVINVIQLNERTILDKDVSDISERLNNYRQLQDKQIEATKNSCKYLENDVLGSKSDRNKLTMLFLIYSKDLAEHYRTQVMGVCYAPLYLISGTIFEGEESMNAVLKEGSTFEINDNAFDKVRW